LEQHFCYPTTHSNTIAAIESGKESAEDAMQRSLDELRPLFPHEPKRFRFGGSILFFQKIESL
jgi:hypothetical protein